MAFDYLPDGIQMYDDLRKEIRAYLAEPETKQDEEPVRQYYYKNNDCKAMFTDSSDCICWHDEGTGPYPEDSIHTLEWRFKPIHPAPRKPFVRLSEEEIMAIVRADPDFDEMMWDDTSIRFARAIEDALEEKNSSTIPSLNDTISANSRDLGHE